MGSCCYDLTVLSLLLSLCIVLPSARSVSFTLSSFEPDMPDILFEGDAKPSNGVIEFNEIKFPSRVGRVTYAHHVHLWNSETHMISDFTTHFSFTIDTLGETNYGAGLAFFLAPAGFQIPQNSNGGFLGLFNTTTNGAERNQIVIVEFDSFYNDELSDAPGSHVGINVNSLRSVNSTAWNASLHSKDPADVWIMYNATTTNLGVSWSYPKTTNAVESRSLSYKIDLTRVLPEWVTIGFSASTGTLRERHKIGLWEFNSSLDNNKTPKGKKARKRRLIEVLAVVAGALIVGIIVTFGIVWRQKQKRERKHRLMSFRTISDDLERGAGPRSFLYKDLASSTKNFSKERKLGEGGFGEVYRGYLSGLDVEIAVKKFSRSSRQGIKEFVTEVKIISQLRHRNLVQLIGWCHDKGEFLLVYEFMPNGSLDSHLYGEKSLLSWALRYKIALGLASALLYLHEEWEQCVVHRDIKSSNIMLDSSFKVKLGDFGLARLMDHELSPRITGLAGTFGYLAPECVITGLASKESDVFSFGVVVLEIVTGRKSVYPVENDSELGLVPWIWELFGREELLSAVDERLEMEFDMNQAECLMVVGLWCAHPDRSLRPSIRQAIQVLNFEASLPKLPARMPVPMYLIPTESWSSVNPLVSA